MKFEIGDKVRLNELNKNSFKRIRESYLNKEIGIIFDIIIDDFNKNNYKVIMDSWSSSELFYDEELIKVEDDKAYDNLKLAISTEGTEQLPKLDTSCDCVVELEDSQKDVGIKYDKEKNMIELISPEVMFELAKGLYFINCSDNACSYYEKAKEYLFKWRLGEKRCEILDELNLSLALACVHQIYTTEHNFRERVTYNDSYLNLIHPAVEKLLGWVLTFGAKKYGPENWKKLENLATRYYAACRRHLLDWADGEELDKESGLPHLIHAMACLHFVLWNELKEEKK